MKKILKGTAEIVSMALVLTGLVICACETETVDKQLVNAGIGFGMMVVGAVIAMVVNGGEKNELS